MNITCHEFVIFVCVIVFCNCAALKDAKRPGNSDKALKVMEDIKKCFRASKALQKDPGDDKRTQEFLEACERFLKEIELTDVQKAALSRVGYTRNTENVSQPPFTEKKDRSASEGSPKETHTTVPKEQKPVAMSPPQKPVTVPPQKHAATAPSQKPVATTSVHKPLQKDSQAPSSKAAMRDTTGGTVRRDGEQAPVAKPADRKVQHTPRQEEQRTEAASPAGQQKPMTERPQTTTKPSFSQPAESKVKTKVMPTRNQVKEPHAHQAFQESQNKAAALRMPVQSAAHDTVAVHDKQHGRGQKDNLLQKTKETVASLHRPSNQHAARSPPPSVAGSQRPGGFDQPVEFQTAWRQQEPAAIWPMKENIHAPGESNFQWDHLNSIRSESLGLEMDVELEGGNLGQPNVQAYAHTAHRPHAAPNMEAQQTWAQQQQHGQQNIPQQQDSHFNPQYFNQPLQDVFLESFINNMNMELENNQHAGGHPGPVSGFQNARLEGHAHPHADVNLHQGNENFGAHGQNSPHNFLPNRDFNPHGNAWDQDFHHGHTDQEYIHPQNIPRDAEVPKTHQQQFNNMQRRVEL